MYARSKIRAFNPWTLHSGSEQVHSTYIQTVFADSAAEPLYVQRGTVSRGSALILLPIRICFEVNCTNHPIKYLLRT